MVFVLSLCAQENGYKTLQDSIFNEGDSLRVYYAFPFEDLKIQPDEWTVELAQFMEEQPTFNFIIEVHTESRGTIEANDSLSARRASAIANDLVELGIDPNRLSTVGKGQRELLVPNEAIAKMKSEEAKEQAHLTNRRVIIHLTRRN